MMQRDQRAKMLIRFDQLVLAVMDVVDVLIVLVVLAIVQ